MTVNFLERPDGCHFDVKALQFAHMDIATQIGRKVRALRRSRMPEMTIEDLADRSGLTRQTIGNIETGRNKHVALTTIVAITRALGVKIDDLLGAAEPLPVMAEEEAEYRKKQSGGDALSHQDVTGTTRKKAGLASTKRRAG